MATSDFWQRLSASVSPSEWPSEVAESSRRNSIGKVKLWMFLDAVTILVSAAAATIYERHTGPVGGAEGFLSRHII